jgi:UDP-N-acetyl-D-glucosamine dehydrogenase
MTTLEARVDHGATRAVPLAAAGDRLLDRIATRRARVAVVGLGYVGLPLAVAFGEAGFRVTGLDVDPTRIATLNSGESYIEDIASERVAALTTRRDRDKRRNGNGQANGRKADGNHDANGSSRRGSLWATTDAEALRDVDAVVICVPTPLSRTKDPDLSYVVVAADDVASRLRPGTLVVLESTTYPGTTEEVVLPRLAGTERGGPPRVVGRDFFLAFSPERIDPGRTDYSVHNTPKVIGGVTPACLTVAEALYSSVIERTVPVSQPKAAEMVKLLENTFRAVNIALVNEIAIICDRLEVDVWEVIEAAKTKPFGFVPFYPGPGLGGHCIPIDPQYLAWKLRTLNYNARFIQLAEEINFAMPTHVVTKVGDALNVRGKALKGSRVLVLGAAYKADVGDTRESPAVDIIELLANKGAEVVYHDPYVPELVVDGRRRTSVELDREELARADCVLVVTAHHTYDWEFVVANSELVVDTRNATREVGSVLDNCVRI